MKTTKVYHAPGYPLDPKKVEQRLAAELGSWTCVMEVPTTEHSFNHWYESMGLFAIQEPTDYVPPASPLYRYGVPTIQGQPILSFSDSAYFDRDSFGFDRPDVSRPFRRRRYVRSSV